MKTWTIALLAASASAAVTAAAMPVIAAQTQTSDNVVDDARRAAATRLLAASHFRNRQEVVLPDGIRTAQADLTSDCIDRATDGSNLSECHATGKLDAAVQARLAASHSDMLDEIISASQTIYARQFTVSEMNQITAFFRTPVGQKYAARYPTILEQVQDARRPILRRYLIAAARFRTKP
jgi:uncharacterized protein